MRFIILSIVLLLNFACSKNAVEETKSQPTPQNSIQPTNPENKLSDFLVYTKVFDNISGTEVFARLSSFDYFIIKKETITPQNIDKVKSLPYLTEDLINDFLEKNKSKGILGKKGSEKDQLDVDVSHKILEQKGSLESFYNAQKKEHPKIKGIVGFSQIGINADKTQTLVYVEFYNSENGLQKEYCLITWGENDRGSLINKYNKWIEAK